MEDELNMEAMNMMAGPAMADETGTTTVEVPNYALAAVTELIAMLEQEMMGGGTEAMMSADMGPEAGMMGPEAGMMV